MRPRVNAVKIALLQINPLVGDLIGNRRLIADAVREAGRLGADLAVTPELALVGYLPRDLLLSAGFVFHVGHILYRALVKREKGLFWGPTSMVPQPRDLVDLYRHVRWFLWLGPKPRFDRYTYWEKFDYWAVFWGMVIIGVSGWMMWFAPFFARFVPGTAFNIALLIHGEEALLAVWFIFMIHWFNADFRPDKFPMDEVIFTGRISEETLREERPLEYERLAQQGSLPALETGAAPRWLRNLARLIGVSAFAVGFALLIVTFSAFFREL